VPMRDNIAASDPRVVGRYTNASDWEAGEGLPSMKRTIRAHPVRTLGKALQILELVSASPQGLRLKDVSSHTGFNKSTAYRSLVHLERAGYLVRNNSNAYVLGMKFIEIATRGNWVEGIRSVAWPFLVGLRRRVGETVNLAVLQTDAVLYAEVLESPHDLRLVSTPGMRRPIHSTALGKVLVASLPEAEQERLIAAIPLKRQTPRTITSLPRLRKELALVRERGYALDDEEAISGARCIAAPVLDSHQRGVAAVSITGPVNRISKANIPSLAQAVMSTAEAISMRAGRRC
jgi:IclR family acetate operon transcriptional repressor